MTWPAEALWEAVVPLLPGFTVEILPQVDSSNSELMRRARAGRLEPVLLVADWAAVEHELRSRRVLRAVSTLLVLLLFGVLASAAYRMRLYQEAYGLTEDRLYGSVFLVWLTVTYPGLALAGNPDNVWQIPGFMGMIVVVGLVLYYGAKFVRRGQGIDIDLVYKELPPE